MTFEQHIQKMRRLADELVKADKPVYLAAQSALSQFSERVFVDGKSATCGRFSYNSTEPPDVGHPVQLPVSPFGPVSPVMP